MPSVSVVIPSFRGGRFLREAIASVQSQTLEDWELVVVLDGCEDDLSDIEQSDPRVRIIRQRNRGEATSRNVGISYTKSEFIALLDDDDRMLPERLLTQFHVMSDESIGFCHTQFRIIDENGLITGTGESKDFQYRDFLRENGAILISTTMIRKALIQDLGGFNPLFLISTDLDLLYRIARESTVCFLPEELTEYRRHSSNVSYPVSGGEQQELILKQHLLIAEARGEVENVNAIQYRLSRTPTGRAARAIRNAHLARTRHSYVRMLGSLALAFLLSPGVTLRLSLRQARIDVSRKNPSTSSK
jgi:glycosyltransferase involved in cell wall biosynthesis